MVSNNKILTVSYGTFSCTLEGFEDSFGTMKAIAEYFRDLAADDRYFGAEPPQPDAEMLARIAEREVARHVRARTEPNRIVLRASDYQPAEPPSAAPVAQPEIQVATEATPDAAPKPAPRRAATPVPVAEDAGEAATAAAPDSIAAKLQRIRAVVSQNEQTHSMAFAEDADAEAPFDADALGADIGELTAALEIDDAAMEAEMAAGELEASAEIAAALDMAGAPDDEDAYDEVYDEPPVDVAAALVRVQEDYVLEDDAEALAEEPVEEPAMPAAEADGVLLADEDDAARFDEDVDDLEDAEPEAVSDAPSGDDIQADEDAVGDSDGTELAISGHWDDDGVNAPELPGSPLFSDIGIEDADIEDADIEDAGIEEEIVNIVDTDAGAAPRLLKVRRADLEAAIAAGDLEEVEDDADIAGDDNDTPASLSAEQEADLERELAKVLAETEAAERALADADRAARAFDENKSRDDLSRLMADAEKRMDAPENSSSREAYSHLRAAVAVAKAETSAGQTLEGKSGAEAYRDDLASVVRPRRPVTGGGQRPERPSDKARPAPLKLVAEQRIDLEAGARGPVMPRRTTHEVETVEDDDDKGFARFASEQGATELPQLLEAAAAYLSFVEGHDQFSRPQLMRKLRQIDNQDFNREDGLRSFGQLLRDGKIEKTGGGRFTAAHDIGFRPDQRAAG